MNILLLSTTDARWNLAVEEYVFDVLAPRWGNFFMLWRNASAVIMGKNQNTASEVNLPYAREHGIQVVRRLSGGGAVYHDLGNLNFTFIVQNQKNEGDSSLPFSELGTDLPHSRIDFGRFCQPVMAALQTFGVTAELSGRNDMTLDGRKFSGNAQYQRNGRVMHHGTLMFNSNLDAMVQVLRVSPENEKLRNKGVPSIRSRVTNIADHLPRPCSLEAFQQQLLTRLFGKPSESLPQFQLSETDCHAIQRRIAQRYGTWEWNIGRQLTFDLVRRRRFEACGTVELSLNIRDGILTDVAFSGDFFGDRDPSELRPRLLGLPLQREALRNALASADMDAYFHCLTLDELVAMFTGEQRDSGKR